VQVSVVAELARNYFELRAPWRLAVAQRSLRTRRNAAAHATGAAMPAWVKNKMLRCRCPRSSIESRFHLWTLMCLVRIPIGGAHRKPPGRTHMRISHRVPIQRLKRLCPSATRASCCSAGPMCVPLNEGWLRPRAPRVAVASLFPQSRSGFLDSCWARQPVFTGDSRAWSVSPGLSWSAFDLPGARARAWFERCYGRDAGVL